MGCNMKNCYNTTIDDIFKWLLANIPWDLLNFLLDLKRCTNDKGRANALGNFSQFSLFAAKGLFDDLRRKDAQRGRFDMGDAKRNDNRFSKIVDDFERLKCQGYGKELEDLLKEFNNGNTLMFPEGLTPTQQQEILKYIFDNNNFRENIPRSGRKHPLDDIVIIDRDGFFGSLIFGNPFDSNNGSDGSGRGLNGDGSNGNGNGFNSGLLDGDGNGDPNGRNGYHLDSNGNWVDADGNIVGGSGNFKDLFGKGTGNYLEEEDMFAKAKRKAGSESDEDYVNRKRTENFSELFGKKAGNPLLNIPYDRIEGLELDHRDYTCFHPIFDINNYIKKTKFSLNITTPERVEYLRRVHHEILLPIFEFYYGTNGDAVEACSMKIYYGLTDYRTTRKFVGGTGISKHLRGKAVDFSLTGIEPTKVIKDIKDGLIKINFGVIMVTHGLHVTLPDTFEGYEVNRMYVRSPSKNHDDIIIEFI